MSQFTPNLRSVDPPDTPDYLAGAVLQGLARPIGEPQASALRSLFWGALSFGLLPLLAWPRRFSRFVKLEQQQLWHLAEWVRLHSGHPDAPRLRAQADRLANRNGLRILSLLVAGFTAFFIFSTLSPRTNWSDAFWASTYGFQQSSSSHWISHLQAQGLFTVWNIGLVVAYGLHWVQLRLHAARVRRFIWRFNAIAKIEGLTPVHPSIPGLGFRPGWVVGAILLCFAGAFWAVPMMLAGAVQSQYIKESSVRDRAALAHRLRAMLLHHRPTLHVPVPVFLRRTCVLPLCRAAVPDAANFCPRCGTHLPSALHRVA